MSSSESSCSSEESSCNSGSESFGLKTQQYGPIDPNKLFMIAFEYETKNEANNCSENSGPVGTIDSGSDNNANNNQATTEENNLEYIALDWNKEDIVNKDEFEISVEAFNLKASGYDLKLWIENDGRIISEIYDESQEKWISGRYFVDDFFSDKEKKKICSIIFFLNALYIDY